MREQIVYLDTSALVKRYMKERDSDKVDNFYKSAEIGEAKICFSLWNVGESTVVFDKNRDKASPKERLRLLIDESTRLSGSGAIEIIELTSEIILKSTDLVLKHHLYISDTLQIATALNINASLFATADGPLAKAAQQEGFKVIKLGG